MNLNSNQKHIDKIIEINSSYEQKYGFADKDISTLNLGKGLNEKIITAISKHKKEDKRMLDLRLNAYKIFKKKRIPEWGADLRNLNFNDLNYFVRSIDEKKHDWTEVPEEIRTTFEKLGIPQTERKFLAGVATQYESEVVYQKLKTKWDKLGIIFLDTDTAYKKFPDLFLKYFGKIIPTNDNKFSALNTAVWSGGSFIYIPKNIKVTIPLQTYFRINLKNIGQFERTLIIADEGSEIHYIEGCTAPMYSTDSLHAAVVEVIVKKGAKVRYTTLQNWSTNVYNLVTKRALVHEEGVMEWVDCNLGSKVTMKYPSIYLDGDRSHGEVLSLALANKGQHIDAGTKILHKGKNTTSIVISRSISLNGGRSTFRSLNHHAKGAINSKNNTKCDAIIMDDSSRTDTYPTNVLQEQTSTITHEATVSKINTDQLNYLYSRGLSIDQASALIINGFIEPLSKELPMEYSMELNSLINMSMEGSVG